MTATEAAAEDALAAGADPLECPACLERGDACAWHDGFGTGWDACAAFMAAVIDRAGGAS